MDLWRISEFVSLSGEGGLLYSARWNTKGRAIVYLADHPSSALLEILVHLELPSGKLPEKYTLLHVKAPDTLNIPALAPVGPDPYEATLGTSRALGDRWLADRVSALARVPSAITPNTWNYLLNPLHPDAMKLSIESARKTSFDERLFKKAQE